MRKLSSLLLAIVLVATLAPSSQAEPRMITPGTQVHLTLLSPISSSASREGDPFVAVVAEPVFLGNQLLIPAGTRVNGVVGTITAPRRFSIIRGEAYMDLIFRSMEVESRLIPVQMSIIAIEQPGSNGKEKARKDMKVEEGSVIEEKHDYKKDVLEATIGTGGGALIGSVFSHVVRGFGIGLAGSAVYIASHKGKDVDIPAQSGFLVRIDNTVTVPSFAASNSGSAVR
jgi:hypothetical protein